MKHKLLVGCLALVTLVVIGATTMRISDYPNRVTPAATDMFLLASTIDHTNYYTTWAQLSAAIGVVSNGLAGTNLYITNIYAGDVITTNITIISNLFNDTGNFTNVIADNGWFNNLYVTNLFAYAIYSPMGYFTNLYAGTLFSSTNYLGDVTITNGLTNLSLTADTILKSDANKRVTSVPNSGGALTNNGTGTFGWDSTIVGSNTIMTHVNRTLTNFAGTNVYFPNIYGSNAFFTNLVASQFNGLTNDLGRVVLTNGMVIKEWVWEGPTNTLYVGSTNRYYYIANTPCSITNVLPWLSPGFANHSVLEITNASTTNITITVEPPIRIPAEDLSCVYTLTNGHVMACSIEWATMGTNSVLRAFR